MIRNRTAFVADLFLFFVSISSYLLNSIDFLNAQVCSLGNDFNGNTLFLEAFDHTASLVGFALCIERDHVKENLLDTCRDGQDSFIAILSMTGVS